MKCAVTVEPRSTAMSNAEYAKDATSSFLVAHIHPKLSRDLVL